MENELEELAASRHIATLSGGATMYEWTHGDGGKVVALCSDALSELRRLKKVEG